MKTHRLLTLAALAASTLALPVTQAADKPGDIVTVASGAGGFKTLVTAVKTAGLVETRSTPALMKLEECLRQEHDSPKGRT